MKNKAILKLSAWVGLVVVVLAASFTSGTTTAQNINTVAKSVRQSGPEANFTPSLQSGWLLGLKSTTGTYQDTGATTPATSNGQSVNRWNDLSGSGNHVVKSGSLGVPTIAVVNGTNVLNFSSATLFKSLSSATPSAFSIHAYFRYRTTPPTYFPLLSFGASSDGSFVTPVWTAGTSYAYNIATAHSTAPEYISDGTWHAFSMVYNGSTVRTFVDGAEVGPVVSSAGIGGVAANASFTLAGFGLGYWSTGGTYAPIQLAELHYYSNAQALGTVFAFHDYFKREYPRLRSNETLVAWVANSLGTSLFSGQADAIPYLVGANSTTINRWITSARGGITLTQMIARAGRDYGVYVRNDPCVTRVAVIWEGRNEMVLNGTTGANAYALTVQLAQILRGLGYNRIVVGTVLPSDSLDNTQRAAYNAAVVADTANFDAVANAAANSTIGDNGDNSNATYYADLIHLTAAGNGVAYPIFQAALEAVIY